MVKQVIYLSQFKNYKLQKQYILFFYTFFLEILSVFYTLCNFF